LADWFPFTRTNLPERRAPFISPFPQSTEDTGLNNHFYHLHRETFLEHYHQRSLVESTFMMMKAKFGDALRSKTDEALTNELLCKVLCHNICVLIQSMYELGIEPEF
jgi:hypothetical protein